MARWLGQVAVAVTWVVWLWLVVCIALEVMARRSGRTPVHLPASRTVQCAAAVLVGTAFAVGSLGRMTVHTPVTAEVVRAGPTALRDGPGSAPIPGVVGEAVASGYRYDDATLLAEPGPVPASVPDDASSAGIVEAGDGGRAPTDLHIVTDRETLWSVAEDRLGAARRWREIAVLNYGVLQPDGGSLDGSHWILPGWVLRLPTTDDDGPSPREADHGDEGARHGTSVPRETSVGGRPSPAADPTPDERLPTLVAAPAVSEQVVHREIPAVPVAPLGAGIVGVGVADLVDRLRRVQQRHRPSGRRIRMPDPELRPFEQRLRVGDARGDLDAVDSALRLLVGSGWSGTGRLVGASLDDEQVRLTFDGMETPVPVPFVPGGDGRSMVVERSVLRTPAGARTTDSPRPVAPTLVSVGRSDGVLAMVAVEGLGSVAIGGDPLTVECLGRAMALELATSRWASGFDLVLVGFGGAMPRGDRVSVAAEAGPVIADLSWRRLTASVQLGDHDLPAYDVARRMAVSGDWSPVVVVCAPTVADAGSPRSRRGGR